VINPYADRPVYLQLADLLREQITSGELRPGTSLPAEPRLAQHSVRAAIAVLRHEGLIETNRPTGNRVRARERSEVVFELGSTLVYRPATPDDRARLRLPLGAHVAEVTTVDGATEVYVADLVIFRSM
jgi:GntR family transcriptional regulator